MPQYRCKHFAIYELVPPHVYNELREKAWSLFDDRALQTLDQLRTVYGRMTVNDYYWGGEREWSGLRTPESPYYRPYSQHTFGRAFDCLFETTTAEIVRGDILIEPDRFPLIGSIELGTSWLHCDVRNCDRIETYYP